MADVRRQEIIDAAKQLHPELVDQVAEELDLMVTIDSPSGNNFDLFYDTWRQFGKGGNKNAVNSWAAYAIGMTTKKPDGDFIPPRRAFARPSPPDIDFDFDYFRRAEVCDYLADKYGLEYVSNIGTYGELKLKSSIRRIGKAIDIAGAFHKGPELFTKENEQLVTEIIASLPKQNGAIIKVKGDRGEDVMIESLDDAYEHCPNFRYYMDKYPALMEHARNIQGNLAVFGVHASGFLISDQPLEQIAPSRRGKEIARATQYANDDLEKIGLIKYDVLGLSTLTTISQCVEMIKENYGIELDVRRMTVDDDKTFALYRSRKLAGVFQCESFPMQQVMADVAVSSFSDIVAAIALFRPGPMESIPEYCARKRGEKPVSYFHPSIEPYVTPYLGKTYGVIAYQEQVMQILKALAGFSVTEGYIVIQGISKKKEHIINRYRQLFIEGCVKKNIPEEVAVAYWDQFITPFARYGFNMAHSCCYAYLSYITAYLKSNYTEEFMCAFLNVENERKKHDKVDMMEADMKKFNIKLLPKKINSCDVQYKIVKKRDVSLGINYSEVSPSLMCKGVGRATAENIAKNRPYSGLRELAAKTDTKLVNTDAIGALIDEGYFAAFIKEEKKKTKEKLMKQDILDRFVRIRDDLKIAAKRGVVSHDMFA